MQSLRRLGIVIAVAVLLIAGTPGLCLSQDYGLALYVGQLSTEKWEETVVPGADFSDATIVAAAGSWTLARVFDGNLAFEVEGQIAKYFGDQDHWEFNLPILGLRWHRFPWDRYMDTSFAWGIGPSYATEIPPVELETNESSSRWLVYWFGELTFAPPAASWELMLRLHHRSDAFGIAADDGGSNALCAGMRYRF